MGLNSFYLIDFYQLLIEAPDTVDRDINVAASGWGHLYQENRKTKVGKCYTTAGGPEMFLECRRWFIQDGEGFETDVQQRCITNRKPPSSTQKECRMLHKEIPPARSQLAKIKVTGKKTVSISRSALFSVVF